MGYKLFLDDERIPLDCVQYMYQRIGKMNPIYLEKWVIVRDYDAFVKYITKHGLPEVCSFDHDLNDADYDTVDMTVDELLKYYDENPDKEKTGYHCAKWFVDYCIEHKQKLPLFIVHSMNRPGTENILAYLNNFKKFQDREDQTT